MKSGVAIRWGVFSEQWRHSYLLLAAVFWVIWRVAALALPRLENTRILGGLHPIHVLLLIRILELAWVPTLVALLLYAASFPIAKLNTARAIAITALSSTALLAFVLLWSLVHISFGSLGI